MKVIVLGAGRVGRVIAADLAGDFDVTCADRSEEALHAAGTRPGVATVACDLASADDIAALVTGHDIVVGAVPGFMGYAVLESVIRAGKPVADISFFPEDAFGLDVLAREKGVPVIVDCGVAPGLCNLVAGRWDRHMIIRKYECLVGGLPAVPKPPFHYQAPFSPVDVIEEYTRPARILEDGRIVVRPALSEVEPETFEGCGPLESFLTDGLRSMLVTMKHIPHQKEKTLRYPGHARDMITLRDAGLFGREPVGAGGVSVVPLELTSNLLFERWRYSPGEEDITVMRIILKGERKGEPVTVVQELFDRYDRTTGTMSMARTTGFTCAAMVHLLAGKMHGRPGISPPETVGADEACYAFVIDYLERRNVKLTLRTSGF